MKSYGITDLIVSPKTRGLSGSTPEVGTNAKSSDVEMLQEMGFSVEHAQRALQLSNNSFDAALELLLNRPNLVEKKNEELEKISEIDIESQQSEYEGYQKEHRTQIERLLDIIVRSFGEVQAHFEYCPLTLQQQSINNLFRLVYVEKRLDRDGKESLAHDVF